MKQAWGWGWDWGCFGLFWGAYPHELGFLLRGQHAHPQVLLPVAQLHHVEGDGLRHCQHHGHSPDQQHLHGLPERDPHALDAAPGRHGPVPAGEGARGVRGAATEGRG